jgi:hypothetical protein
VAKESGKEIKNNLQEANKFARNLKEEFLALDGISDVTKGKMAKMTDSLRMQADIGDQLNALIQERQDFIEEDVKNGRIISDKALEILDTEIELLEKKKEQKDLQDEIKDIGKDFANDMGSALGVSSGLVDAFTKLSLAAIGLAILKEVVGYIADGVARAKELKHELGISAAAAGELESNVAMAKVQTGFLTYSTEELRAAADAVVEATGRINVSPETIANVTEMGKLLSDGNDAAVSLNRTLTNSGVDAGALTEEVKSMAEGMGMEAGPAMDYLAASQNELVGMTKEQILLKAKEGIEMKKLGVDMKKARDIASSALDIEQSLKDEMKLRTMLGKEISFNELRAAQASGDALAVAQAQKNLVDQLGPSLQGNLQVQRMVSEATGMTTDELLNIQNATAENTKAAQDGNKPIEEGNKALAFMAQHWKAILAGILVVVGALFLMGKIKLPGMGGGGGNPVADFIGKFGTTDVLKGAAAMVIVSVAMFIMAKAISAMPTEPGPYVGMAVGLGLMLGALYLLANFPTADLIKGALALVLVGVSLIPFAFAMSLIAGIDIQSILAVAAGIVIFSAIILGLGAIMFSGIGALIFGAGILALIALGAAMIILGAGIQVFNKGVSGLGDNIQIFVDSMAGVIEKAPQLLAAAVVLGAFGIALLPLGVALLLVGPAMFIFGLGLAMVGTFLPIVAELFPILMTNLIQLAVYAPMLLLASAGLLAFGLSLLPLSFALILATPAILLFSIAMLALGVGLSLITGSIDRIGEQIPMLVDQIPQLVDAFSGFVGILPALLLIGPALLAFGFSLLPLSFSLLLATPIIAVFGAAMMLLGTGLDITSKSMAAMGESTDIFIESMMKLSIISPMLVALTPILALFGLALIPLAIGMSMIAVPMIIFAFSLDILAKSLPPMVMMLPLFVASLVTMAEQIPSIIGLAASFMLLTTSMIALATTMVVFTPIFAFGTLVTAALVPAMLFAAFGTGLWAASVQFLSTSFESLIPNLMAFLTAIPMMGMLVTLIPGLVALSGAFFLLSTSLFSLGAGLGFIGLFLPVLAALGVLLPTVAGAFGYGDDESESSSIGGDSGASMNDVVEELRALREDIQQQPILIKVDGKVVSAMSKVQARKQSVRNSGYGG